jgi:hypothetical protein
MLALLFPPNPTVRCFMYGHEYVQQQAANDSPHGDDGCMAGDATGAMRVRNERVRPDSDKEEDGRYPCPDPSRRDEAQIQQHGISHDTERTDHFYPWFGC